MDRYFFFLSDETGEDFYLAIDTDSFVAALEYIGKEYPAYFVDGWRRRKITSNPSHHTVNRNRGAWDKQAHCNINHKESI